MTVPVATAKAGKFHIYSVSTVDEAIKLLTGVTTGELDEDGLYPEGSINSRVQLRLHELAQNCAMNLVTQTRTLMIKAK
ncbi:MAG: hypothetical protein LC437_03945 [Thiohalomonas sp.]|nr:hypothetical protein [Thiohalomonas sp.]